MISRLQKLPQFLKMEIMVTRETTDLPTIARVFEKLIYSQLYSYTGYWERNSMGLGHSILLPWLLEKHQTACLLT